MQLAMTMTNGMNGNFNTAAVKAQVVKADVLKKIGLFAGILACVVAAVFM